MRHFKRFTFRSLTSIRLQSTYGTSILNKSDFFKRFEGKSCNSTNSSLSLLEKTENCISQWKLSKWEYRIPPLLNSKEKEKAMLQLNILKCFFLERGKIIQDVKNDLVIISTICGISPCEVRMKNKEWLQEQISDLRWKGDVNAAKNLRDAFTRLEIYGARDYRILERLSAVYGLGMLNTFEKAFSNLIVEDEVSHSRNVVSCNTFTDLLTVITNQYPYISLLYDFLGFNAGAGYRSSLRLFLAEAIGKKYNLQLNSYGRVIVNDPRNGIVLFDFSNSSRQILSDDSAYGLPDFLYICGPHFFLITIASENFWHRNRQLPHKKQLEGIGRRGSFVLGIPFSEVKIKNILLPPNYIDKASLIRLLHGVVGLSSAQSTSIFPWLSLYDKELDSKDEDFCEMMKRNVDEEWLTL